MIELALTVAAGTLYTGAISFGVGKRLTQTPEGRPILGALGFLIPIAGYSWHRRDFSLFSDLVFWFILTLIPVLVAGVITALAERDREKRVTKRKFVKANLDAYSVKNFRDERA